MKNQVAPEISWPSESSAPSFSPSGSCALAEMPSARRPMPRDSTSATTPRITGSRARRRRLRALMGKVLIEMSPSVPGGASSGAGLRTATAHVLTPRIITPSSTA